MSKKSKRQVGRGRSQVAVIDSLERRCLLAGVTGALETTLPFGATDFVENASGSTIYATIPSAGQVAVIDEATLTVTQTIQVGTKPTGLVLSSDGSTLYVADNGSTNIDTVNTTTNAVGTPLNLGNGNTPTDVQVGTNNRLWVLVNGGTVMQIDATTGASTGASFSTQGGDIRVTPDGTTLLAANFGSSPSELDAWDVSGATATSLYAIFPGSNGKDLEMSPDGSTFVLISGGGNGGQNGPYSDILYDTASGTAQSSVNVGAFPQAFAFSQDETLGFTGEASQTPSVQIYNLTKNVAGDLTFGTQIGTITTANPVQKLFADSNEDLFVDEGNATEVFSTSASITPQPPTVTGVSPSNGTSAGGSTVTITGTNFRGTTAVDFGSTASSSFRVVSSTEITATTPVENAGAVNVTVFNAAGSSTTVPADQYTFVTVPVRNINVYPPDGQTSIAGGTKIFTLGSFSESLATGPYTVTVNWGDGTADTVLTMAAAGNIPSQSHVFTSAATDTVSIRVVDTSGIISNNASFQVVVKNAPKPWIVAIPPLRQKAIAGQAHTFNLGSFVQSKTTGPYSVVVNWGDGTSTALSLDGPGPITAESHTYAAVGRETATITVSNPARTVTYSTSFGVTVESATVSNGAVNASLADKPLKTSQKWYAFTVTYSGAVAIDTGSLDNEDLFVAGPDGYVQSARYVSSTSSDGGKTVTATYRIRASGTLWVAADDGKYHVYVRADRVQDQDGNFVAGGVLGPLKVLI